MRIRHSGRRHRFLKSGPRASITDVVLNRSVEQEHILGNDRRLLPHFIEPVLAYVDAIEQDGAPIGFIEAAEQVHQLWFFRFPSVQ